MNHKKIFYHSLAITLFILLMIFQAGRDYIVHGVHYEYGLRWDPQWHYLDLSIYLAQNVLIVVSCAAIARSVWLLPFFYVFVNTSTQDLLFYGVWHNLLRIAPQHSGVFPLGDWTWMPYYEWFGAWTTEMQIFFSVSLLTVTFLATVLCAVLWSRATAKRKKEMPKN